LTVRMRSLAAGLLMALGASDAACAAAPEVVIDPGGVGPQALQSINSAVGVITRLAQDQDASEMSRLRRRAREATVSALATQGYFSPKVTLEVGKDVGGETWDITIEPNERTTVRKVDLSFTGSIATPAFAERIAQIRKNRLLSLNETENTRYVDREAIGAELVFTRRLCARNGWPIIDVTRRSIEETAAAVLNLFYERHSMRAHS